MDRRSTSSIGFVHFGGDLTAHVDSSHGARLSGGSTGGILEAVGDDTNVSLRVRGQGTGGVLLGNSSQAITVAQGSPVKGIFSTTAVWTNAAISSGQIAQVSFASTTADIQPGDLVTVEPGALGADVVQSYWRLSTAAASRVTMILANPTSTATSTLSGTARITWVDLT